MTSRAPHPAALWLSAVALAGLALADDTRAQGTPTAQDQQITAAPATRQEPAPPSPSDSTQLPSDPAAQDLLARLRENLFSSSFMLTGRLQVERNGQTREFILRIHHLWPERTLVRADGMTRHRGTTWLVDPDGVTAWFPRARLMIDLPAASGGSRLFGSDFTLDDLALLSGDASAYQALVAGHGSIDGIDCTCLLLYPRRASASFISLRRLWIDPIRGAPHRIESVSLRGELVRRIDLDDFDDERPRRWTARDLSPGGGLSRLLVGSFETDPPIDPALFTRQGLRRWR